MKVKEIKGDKNGDQKRRRRRRPLVHALLFRFPLFLFFCFLEKSSVTRMGVVSIEIVATAVWWEVNASHTCSVWGYVYIL